MLENTHLSVKTNAWLLFRIVYLAFILIIVLVCGLTLISIFIVKIIIWELCQRLLLVLHENEFICLITFGSNFVVDSKNGDHNKFTILGSKPIIVLYNMSNSSAFNRNKW